MIISRGSKTKHDHLKSAFHSFTPMQPLYEDGKSEESLIGKFPLLLDDFNNFEIEL